LHAAVFLNGFADPPELLRRVAGRVDLVVAADGGALHALSAGVVPDLVVGTSVGAVNGAFLAAAPTVATTLRLAELWRELSRLEKALGNATAARKALTRAERLVGEPR